MKLMQWLAVGRSLGKVRDDRNRYKLPEQALLPRFGPNAGDEPRRNNRSNVTATATATETTSERNPMRTAEISAGEPSEATGVSAMSAMSAVSGVGGAQASGPAEADQPGSSSVPAQKFPLGRWSVFRNPFINPAKPAKVSAGPARVPVQGELLLDLVKPVRNDLADSDLVVVAGRAAEGIGVKAGAPLTVAVPEPVAAEPVWNRIKTQFFGAEKE